MLQRVKLGDKAKDVISSFEGIVVARTEWLNGCVRISLQPQGLHEGRAISSETFDEEQIEVVEAASFKSPARKQTEAEPVVERTGGDRPSVSRGHDTPARR